MYLKITVTKKNIKEKLADFTIPYLNTFMNEFNLLKKYFENLVVIIFPWKF